MPTRLTREGQGLLARKAGHAAVQAGLGIVQWTNQILSPLFRSLSPQHTSNSTCLAPHHPWHHTTTTTTTPLLASLAARTCSQMSAASPCRQLSAVLIDLSGTLHIGKAALPGAATALAQLRQAGLQASTLCRHSAHTQRQIHTACASQSFCVDRRNSHIPFALRRCAL